LFAEQLLGQQKVMFMPKNKNVLTFFQNLFIKKKRLSIGLLKAFQWPQGTKILKTSVKLLPTAAPANRLRATTTIFRDPLERKKQLFWMNTTRIVTRKKYDLRRKMLFFLYAKKFSLRLAKKQLSEKTQKQFRRDFKNLVFTNIQLLLMRGVRKKLQTKRSGDNNSINKNLNFRKKQLTICARPLVTKRILRNNSCKKKQK